MPTEIVAQNGATIKQNTKIAPTGCPKTTVKKLTRVQELAKALAACRKKDKGREKRHKREVCERQAKKRYGSKAKKVRKKPR
jgi:hypothetical protein